jgi:hypothetical protein
MSRTDFVVQKAAIDGNRGLIAHQSCRMERMYWERSTIVKIRASERVGHAVVRSGIADVNLRTLMCGG